MSSLTLSFVLISIPDDEIDSVVFVSSRSGSVSSVTGVSIEKFYLIILNKIFLFMENVSGFFFNKISDKMIIGIFHTLFCAIGYY